MAPVYLIFFSQFFIGVGLSISLGLCQCEYEHLVTVELTIVGNLCRCTGYRPILDGFNTFTKVMKFPI